MRASIDIAYTRITIIAALAALTGLDYIELASSGSRRFHNAFIAPPGIDDFLRLNVRLRE